VPVRTVTHRPFRQDPRNCMSPPIEKPALGVGSSRADSGSRTRDFGSWRSRQSQLLLALVVRRVLGERKVALPKRAAWRCGGWAALLLWLPPLRQRLHGLAEWAGGVYDRISGRLLGQVYGPRSR